MSKLTILATILIVTSFTVLDKLFQSLFTVRLILIIKKRGCLLLVKSSAAREDLAMSMTHMLYLCEDGMIVEYQPHLPVVTRFLRDNIHCLNWFVETGTVHQIFLKEVLDIPQALMFHAIYRIWKQKKCITRTCM